MKKPDRHDRKKRPVYAYPFKIKLVQEIENGYLSLRYASIKYHVPRSTLDDWRERYGKHHRCMKDKNLSPEKKIKKQQQRIDDLELMLDLYPPDQVRC
jgi:transposase-like protein